jgi:DNA-binding response OmpR family regulator
MSKVMVVDGYKNHGLLCRQELEDDGYHVLLCSDFSTAVMLFNSFCPDIVVMEVHVPSRQELRMCLRTMRKDVPLIIYTAQGSVHEKVVEMADDLVIKSSNLGILSGCIRDVLSRDFDRQAMIDA